MDKATKAQIEALENLLLYGNCDIEREKRILATIARIKKEAAATK